MKHKRSIPFLFATAILATIPATTRATVLTWNGNAGDTWDTSTSQWLDGGNPATWTSATPDSAVFTSTGAGAITVGTGITADDLTFDATGYTLGGGSLTLGGTPTLTVNADAAIGSVLAGTAGLTKSGSGTLTLTGANNYTGASIFGAGTMTFSGAGASTGGGTLALGTATGSRAVLNMNSTGTVTHNTTVNVGGAGASAGGAGAINQTSGTVNLMNNTGYLQLGNGGYGSYVLSAGTLNFTSASGARIGDNTGGLGSFVQTGGTVNMNRYFVVGGNQGTAPVGVATLTGGIVNGPTSQFFIIGNGGTATGTMNIGTAAGGNATIVSKNSNGIDLSDSGSASANLNLNSGTIQFNAGGIHRNNGTGPTVVNLNGGTLKANAANLTLVSNNLTSVNVYNGDLNVDTQTFDSTISANLLTTTGNGIYPTGGVLTMTTPDGAGYIGAPLVTVTTSGTGTGASAIANVVNGEVTGVTLTCPGQGYAENDTVTFTFAGGGSTTAALPFVHTLTAADLAANGAGGLTKLGSGKLTLTGANTFTGPVSVTGKLVSNNLSLGDTTLTINDFTPNASSAPVEATAGFTTSGVVPVVINGTFSAGDWPLVFYPVGGSIAGDGISALQLQTGLLPRGVVATLVDNPTNSSVDLSVTEFNPLTWKGNVNGIWDINTTTNWTIGATPENYLEGDVALFDDSVGAGSTSVILDSTVSPASVTFDNDTKDYTLSGSGAISGTAGLTKNNNGTVTILNANTYSGTTTVNGGTLQFGNGVTNGGITGPLANEATVEFNPAGSSTYAGSISGSGLGDFVKAGTGTQVLTGANASTGVFQINDGTLQIGDGTVNGSTGTSFYEIAASSNLRLERATASTASAPTWANISGAGTLALNSAQPLNGSAQWGNSTLPAEFTGALRIENGRVGANDQASLGGASAVQILDGGQLLVFTGTYTSPIEIAGNGYGENNRPGALRAAGSATANYNGAITLAANATIYAQDGSNTNFTIGGSINGAYTVEFNVGDNGNGTTILNVAPIAAVQNSYTATKINGSTNNLGSVVAGNAYAFSSGPLEVANGILKLNGNSLGFASLTGTGGKIGNYHASAPAVLTVGDSNDTAYSGSIVDGAAAPLGLTKTGAGTLTLTGTLAYSGDTTVSLGTLSISSASLNDNATVSIASGAKVDLPTAGSDTVGKLILGVTEVPAGTYNATTPTYGSYFTGTGSLVVLGGYSSWAQLAGLDGSNNGLTQDPDNDGIENLVEFYLDGNPLASDPSILPVQSPDATYLILDFKRRDDARDDVASQFVQYGSDLTGWTDVVLGSGGSGPDANGVIVEVTSNDAAPDDVRVKIPRSLGAKLFARLSVSK